MVKIFAVKIIDNPYKYEKLLIKKLDELERNRYKKIKNEARKLQFLVGRNLLFYIVDRILNMNFKYEIRYGAYGKPEFSLNNLKFNISHSNAWVICAVSQTAVGVDIENINNLNNCRYIGNLLVEFYEKLSETKYLCNENLSSVWTLREAFIKLKGLEFDILSNNSALASSIKSNEENIYFKQYDVISGYYVTCCSYERIEDEINIIEFYDLLTEWGEY